MAVKNKLWSLFLNPKVIAGFLLSAGGIWLAFHDFNFSEFTSALAHVNYFLFGAAVLNQIFATWIRSVRWKYLLTHEKTIASGVLFKAEIIGYWGNSILPLRMGELLRSYLVTKQEKISGTVVLGSIVLERLLDTIGLMALSVLLILVYPLNPDIQSKLRIGILVIVVGCIILAAVLVRLSKSDSSHKLIAIARKFFSSFAALNGKYKRQTIFITFALWICYWANVLIISEAMNMNLDLTQSLLLIVLSSLAYAIPSAPGTIGTYHAAVKYILVTLIGGYTAAEAINFAVVLHAHSYLLFIVLGSWYFFQSQFSAGAISHLAEKQVSHNEC